MLENIAAQILNRYIGEYVENINTKNLSIGLLQGAVELENLPLKKDALNDLDLPGIVLKSGHIGKIVLRIKSYKTIKEPWIIEIHRLQLVVGPGETTRTVNKDEEKRKKQEQKQRELEALEEKWRAKHGQNTSLYSVWYSYSSSIITTIMENLQFEVHDVHIRYEDDVTLPQKFSCGVCIKNLTSKSTDEKWVPTSGERTLSQMMYKLLQLDGFSVYWDADSEMLGALPPEKLNDKLQKWEDSSTEVDLESKSSGDGQLPFLLTPVCGQARLTKNSSSLPLRSKNKPRISLEVMLGEISLHLSHTQYKQAIFLASELSRSEKRNVYKDGRPTGGMKESAKEWWQWAIETQLKRIKKLQNRSSKTFILNRARNNVDYVKMYEKIIKSKMDLEKISTSESSSLESKIADLEKDLTFHEIQILREVVFERSDKLLKLAREAKSKAGKSQEKEGNKQEKAKGWGSWLRGWGRGWSSEKVSVQDTGSSEKVIGEEESNDEAQKATDLVDLNLHDSVYKDLNEDELYEMFGEELSEQDTNDTFLKRDSVFLNLSFSLDAGTLTLHEDAAQSGDSLLTESVSFIGVEFRDLSATTEWRPRYKSSEMRVDLGGLFVKDLSNKKSCFTELIKPQVYLMDGVPHSPRDSENKMSQSIKGLFDLLSPNKVVRDMHAEKCPVFSLIYQNKPRTDTNPFTNRLEVSSAPIVITFLPNFVERVKEFFKTAESNDDSLELDDGISAAALDKYETWKQQSQIEIRRTVKRMMDGKTTTNVSQDKWAVTLNISAPEIIFPEDSNDTRSNVVIANLGHMTFKNHNEDDLLAKWRDKSHNITGAISPDEMMDDDDNDDFVTPPDTPPIMDEDSMEDVGERQEDIIDGRGLTTEDLSDSPSQQRLNEKLFYERIYEQYQMHFTDLQVLVARNDEKWEATRTQGKGPHHLVEKFSVDLLLERRVVQTLDPKCPAVKLKGNLPNLTIHLSHNKVHSLFNCLDRFSQKSEMSTIPSTINTSNSSTLSGRTSSSKSPDILPDNFSNKKSVSFDSKTMDERTKSKQLLCQFSMNEISVLLEESPTTILSVLEVRRIQTEFTKRPFDHDTIFSIHSMLLIDTKQDIGPDYELLLASHRSVKMDLGSGNILDSGTASPDFDGPPIPVQPSDQKSATKNMLSSVASSLKQAHIFNFSGEGGVSPTNMSVNSENYLQGFEAEQDLITVEWKVEQFSNKNRHNTLTPNLSNLPSTRNSANIKFNNLDLVLNLKSWVAVLDFLHRLKPSDSKSVEAEPVTFSDSVFEHSGVTSQATKFDNFHSRKQKNENMAAPSGDHPDSVDTEIIVEFHKLNILLMRHIEADKVIGRKVATLSLHNTKVFASLGDELNSKSTDFDTLIDAYGSVGGLVLQDLTNAVKDESGILRAMQVLCLGDLSNDSADTSLSNRSNSMTTDAPSSVETDKLPPDSQKSEAFSFNMQKGKRQLDSRNHSKSNDEMMFSMESDGFPDKDHQEETVLNLHLASVLYMHTPRLIAEILALTDEAGDIINAKMTVDTKQAYKEMAFSIMDKSIAVLGKSVMQPANDDVTDGPNSNTKLSSGSLPSLFKLTVVMQSPIVALPKYHGSFELLVGNLGTITVRNGHAMGRVRPEEDTLDFLQIEITDMRVNSKRQVEEEKKARKSPGIHRKHNIKKSYSGPSLAKLKEANSPKNKSFSEIQILHDTSIRLTVVKKPFTPSPRKKLDQRFPRKGEDGVLLSDEVDDGPISDKKMCVTVKMTLPLALSLSKPVYEQVLKTLDHISYGGNIDVDGIELETSMMTSNTDELMDISMNSGNMSEQGRSFLDSLTSQQSTPSHSREFKLFSAPGLEITPGIKRATSETTPVTTRKYTPLYADIHIPEIAVQLNGELSEGEQGVVKVTLEGFSAKFEKENRSSTYLDLTLGSLEIEDLLREENSPHRYIVSSRSHPTLTSKHLQTSGEYLSTSCPPFMSNSPTGPGFMSSSLPANNDPRRSKSKENVPSKRPGVFRPYDSFSLASGPFGVSQATHEHQSHRSRTVSNESGGAKRDNEDEPWTLCFSPTMKQAKIQDETLVRIRAFLVDGKSLAYDDIYNRTNRRIDVDFNSLDCKINLQTWVVLLDFFGIGTAPKKQYELDRQTEEEYNWDRRLAVSSYYENQPDDFINSEIDFKVHNFNLIFNKDEYEFVKANISNFGTHIQIRNGVLGVAGQLGSLSVSDLSPNGNKYKERFVFAGDKALDFDIKKYDEYDAELQREFDIRVKIRMSAICYVHTHRFHQELVAYLLHFQQLQEVLGRMRAASVGQAVSNASRRQARISLDIEADSPVLLIPESSHSDRLIVADLGNLTVRNSFKWNGDPGTLSQDLNIQHSKQENPDTTRAPLSPGSRKCLLDVLHADLERMDLYTAVRCAKQEIANKSHCADDKSLILFSSYFVKRDAKPLLKEKCKLSLQIERNLEKETMVRNVPDTSISGQLSSVYCTLDLQQYWLVRGILDHNLGEPIPEFPQPTAFLQPSDIQTVLSGSVYTGMSIDMHLLNVSVELLKQHKTTFQNEISLARLDYVKSRLSYRSFSNQTKTINLSCEAFVASDTRWKDGNQPDFGSRRSVFSTVLGPTNHSKNEKKQGRVKDSKLQFELQFREGPDFLYFTALLVDMRVYIIADWLSDVYRYIIVNPAQEWCDSLRAKAAGLLIKYNQVVPGQEQQMEAASRRDEQFKLNVTNTDFVLVENPSVISSDAVILRMTAVLHHNPTLVQIVMKQSQEHRKIVNCTLQSLEVFSCQLDCENGTALSIVDPVKVNIEIDSIKKSDLTDDEFNFDHSLTQKNKLEIQISEMNTRVSYNDLLLFLAIMKSLSTGEQKETKTERVTKATSTGPTKIESVFQPPEESVRNLMQLGYSRSDVIRSLQNTDSDVHRAAEWLIENAKVLSDTEIQKMQEQRTEVKKYPFNIGKLFLHVNSMCICLIDDCADCDVPLGELAVRSLSAQQNLSLIDPEQFGPVPICYAGKANFVLSGDYYNRMLSLWEPYLEPWRCGLKWNYETGPSLNSMGKWNTKVQASDRLDITVTSTLIETIKKTKETWTSSFERANKQSENLIDLGPGTSDQIFARKRREFVPYVLRNLTGEPLHFMTHVSTIQQPSNSAGYRGGTSRNQRQQEESWNMVMPGDSHPFRFDRSEKQRHKRSEEIILHQIITKIGEWEKLSPVTISKVGVYFRHATKEIVKSSSVYSPPDPVRVVFAVTLEGSAQKVITVRSALVVRSKIKIPVQIYLVNEVEKPIVMPRLDPGGVQYIPLQLTAMGIKIRPVHSSRNLFHPCNQTVYWKKISRDVDSFSDIVTCQSQSNQDPFRFAVCIKKKSYPAYEDVVQQMTEQHHQHASDNPESMTKYGYVPPYMPGHTIIILPPVVVSNLLPCDLHYFFKDTQVGGKLMPGQDATLHILNLVPGSDAQPPLLLGCGLEGFKDCRELTITHIEKNAQMRMAMLDNQDRTLILNVRVLWRLGCSVKISIMAGYWIVNKTGLPIVAKQEGARYSFAGQYDEHEHARSITPLLFSYSDRELPYLCTMRLGREASPDLTMERYRTKYPQDKPGTPYCQSFSIDGGTCTRNLQLVNHDNSPSRIYYIGVGVRRGWGRYMHTHIVTLAPRFLLVNLTKNSTLSFAQLHATSFINDGAGLNRHLTIIPGSSIVFHWPRADLDLLLCTRLSDEQNCRWSGGFVIDRIDAFHVHLRIFGGAKGNHSIFLRVEITLVDATYRVMFYDGDISSCPSPLRVDNISAAPLVIRQCDTDEGLQINVAPSSQVPYACDEPCLPPIIDCRVEGVAVSVQLNMDNIGEEKVLYYENFIYIVVGRNTANSASSNSVHNEDQLVLTVHQVNYDESVDRTGHLVTLERRRTGNRSQLWRMTSEGYLRHEGTSPPSGGSKYPSTTRQGLVLDIAETARRGDIMPLTIRNIDKNRKSQIWNFTPDGRLCCRFKNLCVQKFEQNKVGFAPFVPNSLATPNQCCWSEKMIAGSGVLALKVVRDGPTRVINVMDIKQKRQGLTQGSSSWVMISRQSSSHSVDPSQDEKNTQKQRRISLNIDMAKGIGFSLISNFPEELLYLTMSGVRLEASLDEKNQKFGLKIQRIQIDNQLLGGRPAVMLHPHKSALTRTQSATNSSSTDPQPALDIEAVKLPSSNSLYEIYHSLSINIGRMCLQLEETLLLKLIQFIGSGFSPETDLSLLDETRMDLIQNTSVSKIMMDSGKRYYFDSLIVAIQPTTLSMFTASQSRMDSDLKAIKQSSSLVLIQFERAPVTMQAYERKHVFETTGFILNEAKKHFTEQLRGQAAKILGAVDFLGNPIGLLSDLKAGLGSMVRGKPGSLLKHVTHGLSNSAAKVTGSLSTFAGGITMDQDHEDKRRAIRSNPNNATDHFVAGLQSLGTGLVGGLTSIVTQTVRGATDEGAKGFFTGFGKGLVGTVTKPVTGVLDFASETASFVRDSSISSDMNVKKVRLPRACHSFQGCLECFSESRAESQQFLHSINGNNYDEWLYSFIEMNRKGTAERRLFLVTNKRIYLMQNREDPDSIALLVNYQDLLNARALMQQPNWSLELAIKMDARPHRHLRYSASSGSLHQQRYPTASKKPVIICHSEATAKRICNHVNYAKMLASEQSETLPINDDDTENDKAFDLEV